MPTFLRHSLIFTLSGRRWRQIFGGNGATRPECCVAIAAERAQYITGASGAAIALREGEELICRARAGPSAPEVGAQLQVSSGLTGESVRTREILRCNDAATDARVNRESCKILGIASVMVMPLLQEQTVNRRVRVVVGQDPRFRRTRYRGFAASGGDD